jgi:PBP1b-binding outer membrane lipoprotein LpoB
MDNRFRWRSSMHPLIDLQKKRMKRILSVLGIALLLVSCSKHITQYDELLPHGASEIQLEKVQMGIDFAYYMKARIDIDGFNSFKETMELKTPSEPFEPNVVNEVSAWWHPKMKNETFQKMEYSESFPDSVSDIYWATYEDGYLYFNRTNF